MLRVLLILCLYGASSIIIRIRHANGFTKKYSVDTKDSVASILGNMDRSASLILPSKAICSIDSLYLRNSTVSDCGIKHGDLLIVNSPRANKPIAAVRGRSSPLRFGSMSRIIQNRASKLRIGRQIPTGRLVQFHSGTRSVFERTCQSGSLVLLLGKSSIVEAATANRNIHTLKSNEANRKIDDVVAVLEVTSSLHSSHLSSPLMRRLESAFNIADALNLTVLGCAFGSVNTTDSWTSKHIHSALQVKTIQMQEFTGSSSVEDFLVVSLHNATASGANEAIAIKNKKKLIGSKVTLEAYHFCAQAATLFKDGILTSAPLNTSSQASSCQVYLNGSVLTQGNEVSSLEATVLLVPVGVSLLNSSHTATTASIRRRGSSSAAKLPVFHHHFPSFDKLTSGEAQKNAEMYLLRLLKNILKSYSSGGGDGPAVSSASSDGVEALDRLRDPHLLMFLHATMGHDSCVALCRHLMSGNLKDKPDATVLRSLDQLKKVLEFRLSPSDE